MPPAHPMISIPAPTNDVALVLGEQVFVRGSLEYPGEVVLHGEVQGGLGAERIFVARTGLATGTIVASDLVVEGRIENAAIFAERIVLRRGSVVIGEMYHFDLVLEAGCLFEGKSRRHPNPTSLAPAEI